MVEVIDTSVPFILISDACDITGGGFLRSTKTFFYEKWITLFIKGNNI